MKIAVIVSSFPAISETFILEQITGIIKEGHQVEIFAESGTFSGKFHTDIEKFGLKSMTNYFPKKPQSRVIRGLKALLLALLNLPRDPRTVIKALDLKRFNTVRQVYTVVPFLGKRFDVIHCHFGPNGILGADLKLLGIKAKLLTSFHGFDVNSYPLTYGKDVYRTLFAVGDFFTANTGFTKGQAVQLGALEDKIDILHESLDIDKFEFEQKQISPGQRIQLLTIGRLVEKKGHKYALDAVAQVYREHKNIHYIIAGDGPLRAELERQTENLGIKNIVEFAGQVDQNQAALLYNKAHIFMLPSITASDSDREGQALVLQEAQACGLPVLATLHNGIPEGVIDGRSAYLVPEKDSGALAERLKYLIDNPQAWPEMGREGRYFVQKAFTTRVLNKQLIGIYEKIVAFC